MAYKFLNEMGLSHIFTIVKNALKGKSDTNHTHLYAGSSSVGGSATSAEKLNSNAGSATQPIYFSGGVPVKTTYTLGASVPSNAKFTDTTYSAMTASEATTGTATTARSITAKVLNDKIVEVVDAKMSNNSAQAVFFNASDWVAESDGWYALTLDSDVAGIYGVYRASTDGTIFSQILCDVTITNGKATLRSIDYFAGYAVISIPADVVVEVLEDENGNNIVTTYATKVEVSNVQDTLTAEMDTVRSDVSSELSTVRNDVDDILEANKNEVAETLKAYVSSVEESNGVVTVTKGDGTTNAFNAGINLLSRNTTYTIGDVVYSSQLPSWAYLECVTEGTTGEEEPTIV